MERATRQRIAQMSLDDKLTLAAHPAITEVEQHALCEEPDLEGVQWRLAQNYLLSPDVQRKLLRHPNAGLAWGLAENPGLILERQKELLRHPNVGVAGKVAARLMEPADACLCLRSPMRKDVSSSTNFPLLMELTAAIDDPGAMCWRAWNQVALVDGTLPEVTAWRKRGEESWSVMAERLGTEPVYGEFILPNAVDGMVVGQRSKDGELRVEGALMADGWEYPRIWSIAGERRGLLDLESLPDIAPTYPSPLTQPETDPSLSLPVTHAGTLLASRGVYALWEREGGALVGWTGELHAGDIPEKRDLHAADLIRGWELDVISKAEQQIRERALGGREL